MEVRGQDSRTLLKMATLEEKVADKAACAAQGAASVGRRDLADGLWRLARRSRVRSLQFQAQALSSQLQGWTR